MSTSGKLADRIRGFVLERVIHPGLEAGTAEVRVRAGDIHANMNLQNRMPAVCAALESRKFLAAANVELIRREGPHWGANATYFFGPAGRSGPLMQPPRIRSEEQLADPEHAAPVLTPKRSSKTSAYLVSCVSRKRATAAPAKDVYISEWFLKARAFVERAGGDWYILSAKYGLIPPEEVIEPYEQTLNAMAVAERRRWSGRVIEQLRARARIPERVVILAGARYREFLELSLNTLGVDVEVPMRGMRIGEQLSWLTRHEQG